MGPIQWEALILRAQTDEDTRQRLVQQLIESDLAIQLLRTKGYGIQGQPLLEMVKDLPPAEEVQ